MPKVLEVLEDALGKAGVYAPGETLEAADITSTMRESNRFISYCNTQRLLIYTIDPILYPLVPGDPFGTLGPGGTLGPVRPLKIEYANLVFNPGFKEFRWPLTITSEAQRTLIQVPSVTGPPTTIYPDNNIPLTRIYFYPVPDQAYGLELWQWQPLKEFTDETQDLIFPDGYDDFFVNTLAVRFATLYDRPINPEVQRLAKEAFAAVKGSNIVTPIMRTEPEFMSPGMGAGRGWYGGPFITR